MLDWKRFPWEGKSEKFLFTFPWELKSEITAYGKVCITPSTDGKDKDKDKDKDIDKDKDNHMIKRWIWIFFEQLTFTDDKHVNH